MVAPPVHIDDESISVTKQGLSVQFNAVGLVARVDAITQVVSKSIVSMLLLSISIETGLAKS